MTGNMTDLILLGFGLSGFGAVVGLIAAWGAWRSKDDVRLK